MLLETQLKVYSIFLIVCIPRIMLDIKQINSGESWEDWGGVREDSLTHIA